MPTSGRATAKLARAVLAALRAHGDRLEGGTLVLAVSGGADSLALLLAASSLSPRRRPSLLVAHFSHGLRPSAEKREAALVRRAAAACGLPLTHGAGAAGPAESDAREARYAFLASVARAAGARAVATAHTEDDQAETVLLRLTRGAGLRGAAAMAEIGPWPSEREDLLLLRPLLGTPRALTEQVCEEARFRPARDGSNRNLRFARNRVRRRVLPELERINPSVRSRLAGFAQSARDDDALLAELAADAVAGAEKRSDGEASWPRDVLAGLPLPLFARVAQDAFRHVRGAPAALSSARVRAMQRLAANPRGGELALGGGTRFVVEQETCRIAGLAFSSIQSGVVPMTAPGVTIFDGWMLTAELMAHPAGAVPGEDPWQAWLDADVVSTGLCVRAPARGDRFQPLGMDEGVRLQDVLVNAKVPRSSRASLPLVACPQGIAWVPGVRIAHWARVTPGTRRVLALRAQPAHSPG